MEKSASITLTGMLLVVVVSACLMLLTGSSASLATLVGGLCDNDSCENQNPMADECHHDSMGPNYDRCQKYMCLWTMEYFGQCADGAVGDCSCSLVYSSQPRFAQEKYIGDSFADECNGYWTDYQEDPWLFTVYPAMDCNPLDCEGITGRCQMSDGSCTGTLAGDPTVWFGTMLCPES